MRQTMTATATAEWMIERRGGARSATRQRANFVIFLGPAIVLTVLFFIVPVLIDIAVSFTDLSRSLRVTEFTTEQYQKIFRGDRRLTEVIGLTFIYVFGTLAIFNVTFGLILALATTSLSKISGGFFRGVWLLPRMSPSVLYILLWLWVVSPTEVGLLNQVLMNVFGLDAPIDLLTAAPIALIIIANGFIGASMGMIIFTAAIRGIPEHLFHAAAVDGAGTLRAGALHHPARASLADQLRDDLPDALAAGQLRIHPAAHQGRAVLRHDRLRALHLPPRLRERPVRLRRRARAFPDRHRRRRGAARLALLRHGAPAAAAADRGALRWRPGGCRRISLAAARRRIGTRWRRARALARRTKSVTLYAFLIAVSLPIILPYFWLVTIAFSAKTGIAETFVLWRSMFVLVPAVIGLWLAAILARNRRQTWIAHGCA